MADNLNAILVKTPKKIKEKRVATVIITNAPVSDDNK